MTASFALGVLVEGLSFANLVAARTLDHLFQLSASNLDGGLLFVGLALDLVGFQRGQNLLRNRPIPFSDTNIDDSSPDQRADSDAMGFDRSREDDLPISILAFPVQNECRSDDDQKQQ